MRLWQQLPNQYKKISFLDLKILKKNSCAHYRQQLTPIFQSFTTASSLVLMPFMSGRIDLVNWPRAPPLPLFAPLCYRNHDVHVDCSTSRWRILTFVRDAKLVSARILQDLKCGSIMGRWSSVTLWLLFKNSVSDANWKLTEHHSWALGGK